MKALAGVPEWVWYAAGGVALYVWARGVRAASEDAAKGAVGVAGGVVTGTVKGVGGIFGIPDTDASKCQDAQLGGDAWEVSKYCPAADFAAWTWEKLNTMMRNIVKPAAKKPAAKKPAAKKPAVKSGYPGNVNDPYYTVDQVTGGGCVGGICGPSFESMSKEWFSDKGLLFSPVKDAGDSVLRPVPIVPVVGLRG
jgi:hypothetical protein